MVLELNFYLKRALEDTFDSEAKKLLKLISNKYGQEYKFTYDDLLKFYQTCQLKISARKSPKLAGKSSPKTIPDDSIRCCARVWAHGFYEKQGSKESFGDRCQRKRIGESEYCSQHTQRLVHGRFDQKPDQTVKGFFIKVNDPSYDYY